LEITAGNFWKEGFSIKGSKKKGRAKREETARPGNITMLQLKDVSGGADTPGNFKRKKNSKKCL